MLGVCRNPRSCSPQGNVCHYREDEDYPCQSVSSAPNNCCGDTGGQDGMCQLDAMGVPRCNGLAECVPTGGACSSSLDCCDNVPCVWNADAGQFQCYDPPTDDPCVPSGGPCTVNADCCPPSTCIRPVGSTQGTCGEPPGEGGAGGGPSTPPCAEYGQLCNDDSDCCNGVPCNAGMCVNSLG